MSSHLAKIFEDETLIDKIKGRLPYSYQLAELESSRAGKIGMEVGSLREKIIVALLIYKFGESNVKTDISIKTITGRGLAGVKLIWTVDAPKAILSKRGGEVWFTADMLEESGARIAGES